jgi:hypothetical protein
MALTEAPRVMVLRHLTRRPRRRQVLRAFQLTVARTWRIPELGSGSTTRTLTVQRRRRQDFDATVTVGLTVS